MKATERRGICAELKSLDLRSLLLEVEASIDKGLDLQCFPERKSFWDSIKGSEELHTSQKFVELYKLRAKGRDMYSYFYRDWLKYMLTFTTTEFETDLNRKQWDALASHHQGDVSDDTKRVILCGVLHGVQSRLQQQIISSEIERASVDLVVVLACYPGEVMMSPCIALVVGHCCQLSSTVRRS